MKNKTISFIEIKRKFASEWVLLENPKTATDLRIKQGQILYHSKNRNKVYRKAKELKPKHSAIIFTGKLPMNSVVIL